MIIINNNKLSDFIFKIIFIVENLFANFNKIFIQVFYWKTLILIIIKRCYSGKVSLFGVFSKYINNRCYKYKYCAVVWKFTVFSLERAGK